MKKLEELGISNFPWELNNFPYHVPGRILDHDGNWLAEASGYDEEMQNANARLIAAAPELYDALLLCLEKMCVRCCAAEHAITGSVPCAEGCDVYKKAKDALDRANEHERLAALTALLADAEAFVEFAKPMRPGLREEAAE